MFHVGTGGSWPEVNRPELGPDHLPQSVAKVGNEWSHAFMTCWQEPLPLMT